MFVARPPAQDLADLASAGMAVRASFTKIITIKG
jgi:hypothetical protein